MSDPSIDPTEDFACTTCKTFFKPARSFAPLIILQVFLGCMAALLGVAMVLSGSFFLAIFFLLCAVGLLYRFMKTGPRKCPSCGNQSTVPITSPAGRELWKAARGPQSP